MGYLVLIPTPSSESAYVTPPTTNIPPTEAAIAHDFNTSTAADSSLFSGSSQTQKNPTKEGVKGSVTKQPKQDLVETETKPKQDPVAKITSIRSDLLKLLDNARKAAIHNGHQKFLEEASRRQDSLQKEYGTTPATRERSTPTA
ncbi:uncharacterized protein LOC143608863 [Bidens hawaiensis]|uniref:uncharacterized protein LOC143608863 n=1 Tax=Bidens hawaiensis TaxID=980011 RepID=UPI00404AAEBA